MVQDPRTALVLSHNRVLRIRPRLATIDNQVDLGPGLRGLAVAPDTSFYVGVNHGSDSSEVLHVPRGAFAGEPVPIAPPLTLGHVRALALEPGGQLLVATALRGEPDPLSTVWGSVVRLDPAMGATTVFDLPDRMVANGITVDEDGSILLVTEPRPASWGRRGAHESHHRHDNPRRRGPGVRVLGLARGDSALTVIMAPVRDRQRP